METKFIDLRSDTVTKPTIKMRKAMMSAEVGDDVYGEDPTVNKLEEFAANLLGKESAIFVCSGTMGNQIAVKCHTDIGDEVILEASSHIYNFEMGMMAAFSGTLPRVIEGKNGFFDEEQLRKAIRSDIYYLSKTKLLCLENSHNSAGGRVLSLEKSASLCKVAKDNGLKCHLDGARIFNAAIALKTTAKEIAKPYDSVMFCISKGLSAPIGSLLVGSKEFIAKARRVRKMLGGGMRQAGVIAICGLIAFEEILPKLEEDHKKAKILAEGASKNKNFDLNLESVETNIFMIKVKNGKSADYFAKKLKEMGILVSLNSSDTIRVVTHKDISFEDAEKVNTIFETIN